ncbi:hypothetical protein D9758_003465 [Tetrapyrgos nigripes]|uniref:Nephrocystin 3-like N-terminal domain-containing protein n=1 Tax=Tetrapyrgos nigripes TaxID=182062 RepID=A0A8H5LVP2_9AGAR|nr:hypothetical protein D9758_003465 [Tetrapyrgos nigripes]
MAPGLQLKSIQVCRAEGISSKHIKKSYVTISYGDGIYKSSWPYERRWDLSSTITSSNAIHAISFDLFRYRRIWILPPLKLASASVETRMLKEAGESEEITISMNPGKADENRPMLVIKVTRQEVTRVASPCLDRSTAAAADRDSLKTLSMSAVNTSDSESNQVTLNEVTRGTSPDLDDSSTTGAAVNRSPEVLSTPMADTPESAQVARNEVSQAASPGLETPSTRAAASVDHDSSKALSTPATDSSESNPLGNSLGNLRRQTERIGKVIEVIKPVQSIFDSIANIHPIAKGLWLVVSSAYQVMENQHDKDTQLVNLYNLMMKTYNTATENDLYKQVGDKKLSAVIDAMVKQSKECSVFIANYGSRGYLARLEDFEASRTIQKFSDDFNGLEKAFATGQLGLATRTVLETKALVAAMSQGLLSADLERKLVGLAPSTRSPGAIAHCKYGTRQQSLLKITGWTTQGKESVFWLYGVAGCGKSSLMGTMIEIIQQMGTRSRLAAFIRFDRGVFDEARVVVRELAYQLALFDARLGEAIADAFRKTSRILSPDLRLQLEQLVLEPLDQCRDALEKDGPVAIIFDGLDECKDDEFLREFLKFFSDNVFAPFPHIRVIIASRPKPRIRAAFSNADSQDLLPHIHRFPLDTLSQETREDIRSYIENELSSINEKGFRDMCIQRNAAAELAQRASGLFIWAVVILKFLRGYACTRLEIVLRTAEPTSALSALTTLYQTALSSIAAAEGDEDIRRDLRLLLGFIKFTRPDKNIEWTILLQSLLESYTGADWSSKLPDLCDKLSSLLVYDESQRFRLIHKSLDDFLTDRDRCGDDWLLDHHNFQKNLASACSKLLMSHLGNVRMSNSVSSKKTVSQYASEYWHNYYIIAWQSVPRDNNFDIGAELSHLLQRYLLRWTRDDPFARLIREANRLCSALLVDPTRAQKEQTILYFFDFLCAAYRKDINILHRCYMLVFVQMAGGSRNYGDIIEAIKALNDYPPLLSEEDTPVEDIQIIGIPELIDDEMLAKVDWDLVTNWYDHGH